MVIKLRFRFPEIVFGMLLAVAIFAMGATFWSSPNSSAPTQQQTNSITQKDGYADKNEIAWWQDPVAIFTLGLVFIGAIQAFIFYGQMRLIRRSLKPTESAAKAARDQADLLKESMIRTQRAFVFVKAIAIEPSYVEHVGTSVNQIIRDVTGWTISFQLENSGETPTQYLFNHISSQAFDAEMPNDFDFPDLGDLTRVPNLIGPRSFINTLGFYIPVADGLKFKDTGKHFYIWGWAEYDDIFDKTPRHRLEFCTEFFFDRDVASGQPRISLRMHRRHNGADEECEKPLQTNSPKPR